MNKFGIVCLVTLILVLFSGCNQVSNKNNFIESYSPKTIVIKKHTPGIIVVDASGENLLFPFPKKTLNFESTDGLINWSIKTLNAIPVYDKKDNIIGARGTMVQYGDIYVADKSQKKIRKIKNAIVALLGGKNGYFTIAQKKKIFSKEMIEKGVDSKNIECNDNNTYCIETRSGDITIFFLYSGLGSETIQNTGGYKEETYFCSTPPFLCRKYRGSNNLCVASKFYEELYGNPVFAGSLPKNKRFESKRNVTSIKVYHFYIPIPLSSGSTPPEEETESYSPELSGRLSNNFPFSGICGSHGGSGAEGSVSATSGIGNVKRCDPIFCQSASVVVHPTNPTQQSCLTRGDCNSEQWCLNGLCSPAEKYCQSDNNCGNNGACYAVRNVGTRLIYEGKCKQSNEFIHSLSLPQFGIECRCVYY